VCSHATRSSLECDIIKEKIMYIYHRIFRLCINKVDKDLQLNVDVLPADITISSWHFKGKPSSEVDNEFLHSDANVVSGLKVKLLSSLSHCHS